MKCPICGAGESKGDTRDVPFYYNGGTTVVVALTGQFCDICGNSILTKADQERFAAEAIRFKLLIDNKPG